MTHAQLPKNWADLTHLSDLESIVQSFEKHGTLEKLPAVEDCATLSDWIAELYSFLQHAGITLAQLRYHLFAKVPVHNEPHPTFSEYAPDDANATPCVCWSAGYDAVGSPELYRHPDEWREGAQSRYEKDHDL